MAVGKAAIVTGAGRGIGAAIAEDLARREYGVVAAARSGGQLDEVCERIRRSGGMAVSCLCDVTVRADVAAMVDTARSTFGRIDVLVNNAGVGYYLPLGETTEEMWDEMVGTNLTGAFRCTRGVLPIMEAAGRGMIINLASIAAVRGFHGFAAYSATKGGLLSFSRALREEVRGKGVRVCVVMPGATASSIWEGMPGDWDASRMMRCEDVARVIGDIATQPASMSTDEIVLMPAGGPL